MDTNYLENNYLTLVGKVTGEKRFSHEIYGEKFYSFNLSIPRLSGNADIIPITISERLITDEMLTEGNKLLIKGQFRSYNSYENERNKLILTVFAKDVEIADLLLAVNRAYNKSDYIPTIAWGRNARFCQNLEVGAQVKIIGRVQSRQYEKKYEDGTSEMKVAYEVSICSLELINEEGTENKNNTENESQEAV